MSTTLSRVAIGGALAVAAPILAADQPSDRGWFVEASALTVESSGRESGYVYDGEEPGRTIGGGYAFNRHLALQATYHRFGEHFATDCPGPVCTAVPHEDLVDLEGLSLAVVGTWQVTPKIDLFGKLGVLGWDADFQAAGFDDSGNDGIVGIGAGFALTPRWRLNLQLERVDFDLESAGLGATYRF